ncbi:hypothetical protein [Pedobacter ureilyticus]|uniref:Uncharacterized protein n=1 Tax=Pedobacter ureilyticus TaxID=1393051 RepID=A0ABW9J399_9SPHI|nr:hypothetical protein [Pedobacter helvus]
MKYPFTNAGFMALQQQFHQLDDQSLSTEANLIQTNFGQWLFLHFELSPKQQSFFSQLAPSAVALYACETAFALENRLMVSLDKDEKDKDKDEQGKIIWSVSSLSARSGINSFEPSGTLTFYIRYT